jgi:hypothetical protein
VYGFHITNNYPSLKQYQEIHHNSQRHHNF